MNGFGRMVTVGLCVACTVGASLFTTGAGTGRANESRIATVDVIQILQEMLRTPEYFDPREELRARSEQELKDLQNGILRIRGELQLVTPEERATRGQQLYNEMQQKQQEYERTANQRLAEFQAYSGDQAASAYEKIYKTAVSIAEKEGYTHVLATRAGAAMDERESIATVTQGILARPVLMYPPADDLTARVREALGYEVPTDRPEAAEEDAQPSEPTPADDGGGQP
ncbi:MAG: hypothetical protein Kow0022_05310 [Phycisphaerales bacterium]